MSKVPRLTGCANQVGDGVLWCVELVGVVAHTPRALLSMIGLKADRQSGDFKLGAT